MDDLIKKKPLNTQEVDIEENHEEVNNELNNEINQNNNETHEEANALEIPININSEENIKTKEFEEIERLKDSNVRLLAEIINIRKNIDLDKQKAKQGLILKIISILDTYTIVSNNLTSSLEENELKFNFDNILQQLEILLATEGVQKIGMKVGDTYDNDKAEVISTIEGEEDGKISAIINSAYEMGGKLIKTAKIVVTKKK